MNRISMWWYLRVAIVSMVVTIPRRFVCSRGEYIIETKVPFYNVVNIFLPGLVLIGSCVLLFLGEVKTLTKAVTDLGSTGLEVLVTVSLFAVAYEVGYIIFRFGATFIEPLLKKMFGWADYKDFIAAGKTSTSAHDKLDMLSREYGYARTQITLCLTLATLTGVREQWWLMVCCIFCVILFTLTARGHMNRIQTSVAVYLAANSNENEASNNT